METINISSLKSHLSEILARVRSGLSYQVVDRKEPIALLTKIPNNNVLSIFHEAGQPFEAPRAISSSVKSDAVSVLLEDRQRR